MISDICDKHYYHNFSCFHFPQEEISPMVFIIGWFCNDFPIIVLNFIVRIPTETAFELATQRKLN